MKEYKMTTLCRLPWTGFSVDVNSEVRPCCIAGVLSVDNKPLSVVTDSVTDILLSKPMVELRQQMRNGEHPTICRQCWDNERVQGTSKRLFYLEHSRFTDPDWWVDEPVAVEELQVSIDNNCNLKCRTCGPTHSSKWVNEAITLNSDPNYSPMPEMSLSITNSIMPNNVVSKFWVDRHEWYNDITRLEVMGGEPTYSKHWQQIFNELSDLPTAKQIEISVATNCTIFDALLLDKMLDNFKATSVALSIDGLGSTFEYMRYPAKWDVVFNNMQQYHNLLLKNSKSLYVGVNYTASWMNIFDLLKMHRLLATDFQQFKLYINVLTGPSKFALWAVPDAMKVAIDNMLSTVNHHSIPGIREFLFSNSVTDEEFLDNLRVLKRSDIIRGQDLLQSIPALIPYISKYWEKLT